MFANSLWIDDVTLAITHVIYGNPNPNSSELETNHSLGHINTMSQRRDEDPEN